MKKLSFYFINGRPGSGKDTQALLLEKDLKGAVRISTGDLIRESKPDGKYPQFYELVKPYIEESKSGGLIPSEVVFEMVNSVMGEEIRQGRDAFIFTGFPRRLSQLDVVDDWLGAFSRDGYEVSAKHIAFSVAPEVARSRAAYRREQAELKNEEPRDDDLADRIETRLATYRRETHPMIRQLYQEDRVQIINARGTIEQVHALTCETLGINLPNMLEGGNSMQARK